MRQEEQVAPKTFEEAIGTVKGAQELINLTLVKINESLADKSKNPDPDKYEKPGIIVYEEPGYLFSYLTEILSSLPEGVKAVSIGFSFKKVDDLASKVSRRDFELRDLQRLLKRIGIQEKDGVFEGEVVVKPPYLPRPGDKDEARETLMLDYFHRINVLLVKPYGFKEGFGKGLNLMYHHNAESAIDFRIPFAQITHIKLETEGKPLTPWVAVDKERKIVLKPVAN